MAVRVLTNVKVYLAQNDISGDLNAVAMDHNQAEVDATFYPSGASATTFKGRLPGQQDGNFSLAGAVNLADDGSDELIEGKFGVADVPILVGPDGTDIGDIAYFGVIQEGAYQAGGAVGEMAKISLAGVISNHALVRGYIELAPIAFMNTNNGTGQQLGAVTSSQRLYASLHTTAFDGTSFVAKVQSAATQGGSYTDRITFSTVTAKGAEFATPVAGAITDSWWRIAITSLTGTSFTAVGSVGIR